MGILLLDGVGFAVGQLFPFYGEALWRRVGGDLQSAFQHRSNRIRYRRRSTSLRRALDALHIVALGLFAWALCLLVGAAIFVKSVWFAIRVD